MFAKTFCGQDSLSFGIFIFDYFDFKIVIWFRANMPPSQVIHLPMWLEALIMWLRRCCGSSMVKNVMFGVQGLLFIYCLVGSLHFGMVRNLTLSCFLFCCLVLLLINCLTILSRYACMQKMSKEYLSRFWKVNLISYRNHGLIYQKMQRIW